MKTHAEVHRHIKEKLMALSKKRQVITGLIKTRNLELNQQEHGLRNDRN